MGMGEGFVAAKSVCINMVQEGVSPVGEGDMLREFRKTDLRSVCYLFVNKTDLFD